MQYQVYSKQTGEVVVWIDTETSEHIIHKDYDIKAGENLTAVEVEETGDMKAVSQFEKVSYEQYLKDTGYVDGKYIREEWESVKLPIRKTAGSAGYDFLAPHDIVIKPHETVKLATGIKCQIDEGFVLELYLEVL